MICCRMKGNLYVGSGAIHVNENPEKLTIVCRKCNTVYDFQYEKTVSNPVPRRLIEG